MLETKRYACPMSCVEPQTRPGDCPVCGMELVPEEKVREHHAEQNKYIHEHHKHHAEHHHGEDFLKKFWICLILTIPVLFYSELFEKISGFKLSFFFDPNYLSLILSSFIFFYGGLVFIKGAYHELRSKSPGMMTLIALAITTAYVYSLYAIFFHKHILFWELSTLITIMLLGHHLEMKAVESAQSALKEIQKLLPDTAEIVDGDKTEIVPLKELKEGDIVLIRPGMKIPADGVVIEGSSEVNEAMITGESRPVPKNVGSPVIAGTLNGDGFLKVKITGVGQKTFLAGIMKLIEDAQASKSRLQKVADVFARHLTFIAVSIGVLSFIFWVFLGRDFSFALERLVSVLVVACPHALGLAIPLVVLISTALSVKSGFLVRNRLALETARKIDVVIFDKTGTLTKGEYGVFEVLRTGNFDVNEILKFSASADSPSEHFIARAIMKSAEERNINILPPERFQRIPGKGVRAYVDGKEVLVGGEAILGEKNIILSNDVKDRVGNLSKGGKTAIYLVVDGRLEGIIFLADIIRPEAKYAVRKLSEMGIKVAMITGDSHDAARWVAEELGIDDYFAGVLPHEKVEKVKLLQEKGYRVMMVGDGINDAPALVQADVGVAIGAGTNVAIESADIILVRNDPSDILKIVKLSKATYNKMFQNLFWASFYNIITIPLAAGILAFKGIFLQPALSALLMSLSTIIVALNSLFLKIEESDAYEQG